MVILIIIALMMIIIVPHFISGLTGRKAERVRNDLVTLNAAIEHYALDNGKVSGAELSYSDLRKYLNQGSDVYRRDGRDIFGDTYGPFVVGSRPGVPAYAAEKLSSAVSQDFWSPFQ